MPGCAATCWFTFRRLMKRAARATLSENILFRKACLAVRYLVMSATVTGTSRCWRSIGQCLRMLMQVIFSSWCIFTLLSFGIIVALVVFTPLGSMDIELRRQAREARLYVRPLEDTALLRPLPDSPAARACALRDATVAAPDRLPAPAPAPPPLRLLMMVASAPAHAERRQAIRDTWGGRSEFARLVFVLGRTPGPGRQLSDAVLEEAWKHGDMVVDDFMDVSGNLTLKTLFLLKWAVRECPAAEFVLKADDDVLLHTRGLVRALPRWAAQVRARTGLALDQPHATPALVFGHVHVAYAKWYFAKWQFLPNYVSGMAYVMSRSAVLRLYSEAMRSPLASLENDASLTGFLSKHLAIPRIHTNRIWPHNSAMIPPSMLDHPCYYHHMIALPLTDVARMQRLWNALVKLRPKDQCNSYIMRLLGWFFAPSPFRVVPDDLW